MRVGVNFSNFADAAARPFRHTDRMEASLSTHHHDQFALWHIPTSTLLLASDLPAEILGRIENMIATGCELDEMMLNIERHGSSLDAQFLGRGILAALDRYLSGT